MNHFCVECIRIVRYWPHIDCLFGITLRNQMSWPLFLTKGNDRMMNTKLYKSVLELAGELMNAAQQQQQASFDSLYEQLKALCIEHENTEKDHPVQWETLADFTDEFADALLIYEKALAKAIAINAKDYMSSIGYAMATMHVELGQTDAAIACLQAAQISANKIPDKALKAEIAELLGTLK